MNMEWVENKEPCVDCGNKFQRVKKRGRPPVRCPECHNKINDGKAVQAAKTAKKLANKEVIVIGNQPPQFAKPVKLWEGKEVVMTRANLPVGREAQCPLCLRMFTSDTVCEQHKPYTRPETMHCKTPTSLGMIAIERRGLPIWTRFAEADEE